MICKKCNIDKSSSSFRVHRRICKSCLNDYSKRKREEYGKEYIKNYNKEYYQKHKEHIKTRSLKYKKQNPIEARIRDNNRRCKNTCFHSLSAKDIRALFIKQGNECVYCETKLTIDSDWNIDHIIPIAKGGENHIDNIQITCASCNKKKSTLSHKEYLMKTTCVPF